MTKLCTLNCQSIFRTNNYRIERIHESSSDEKWDYYYNFRLKCSELKGEDFLYKGAPESLKNRGLELFQKGFVHYIIWKNEEEAGFFTLFPRTIDEVTHIYFKNDLLTERLDAEIMMLLKEAFLEFGETAEFFVIKTQNGELDYLHDLIDIEVSENKNTYELRMDNIDMNQIDRWIETYDKKFSNYSLKFYTEIPEKLLKEYAEVFTVFVSGLKDISRLFDHDLSSVNGVKNRQTTYNKMNHLIYQYLIFNEIGKFIGHTYLIINKHAPKVVFQNMTGILPEYRKRGMAKWLKAAMVKKLKSDFPMTEIIETKIHPKNEASKRLNEKIGFVQTGIEKEFIISRTEMIKL